MAGIILKNDTSLDSLYNYIDNLTDNNMKFIAYLHLCIFGDLSLKKESSNKSNYFNFTNGMSLVFSKNSLDIVNLKYHEYFQMPKDIIEYSKNGNINLFETTMQYFEYLTVSNTVKSLISVKTKRNSNVEFLYNIFSKRIDMILTMFLAGYLFTAHHIIQSLNYIKLNNIEYDVYHIKTRKNIVKYILISKNNNGEVVLVNDINNTDTYFSIISTDVDNDTVINNIEKIHKWIEG